MLIQWFFPKSPLEFGYSIYVTKQLPSVQSQAREQACSRWKVHCIPLAEVKDRLLMSNI